MNRPYVIDGRHIQDHFPGIGRYVFNLIVGLARLYPTEPFRIVYNPQLVNTRFDLLSLSRFDNVELTKVDTPTFSLREQFLVANRRVTENARLWHSPFYIKPYWLSTPSVVTLEDVTPLILREEMPSAAKRLLYRGLNLLAGHTASRIITLSCAAREDIQRVLGIKPEKIVVVPLAADARFLPATPAEVSRAREQLDLPEAYALYVGSNKPHKNLARLMQAWALIPKDLVLVIAGHWDPRYPEAEILVRELGLGRRVLFRPNVPALLLPALMTGAFLFVFPSVHEGFGLPPLEAMSCGVPVVSSGVSSLREVVGEAAEVFDPIDVRAMADALTRVIENPTRRSHLAAQGLAQAKRFSWERAAGETMDVYKIAAVSRKEEAGRN